LEDGFFSTDQKHRETRKVGQEVMGVGGKEGFIQTQNVLKNIIM
jgi:hypothetical protein